MSLLLIVAFGVLAGILIGLAGIGGVVLVPLLVYFAGVDIHAVIAASVASFFVSGLVGTLIYSKRGVIKWLELSYLSAGSIPGAFLGALVLPKVDGRLLTMLIAVALILTSYRQIFSQTKNATVENYKCSNNLLILVGFFTGFLSVMSGTGGPLVLLPVLAFFSISLVTAIALSQAIQLPISIFATMGNVFSGLLDLKLVLAISVGLAIGTFFGAKSAEFLPVEKIRALVAFLLLGSGLYIIAGLVISG